VLLFPSVPLRNAFAGVATAGRLRTDAPGSTQQATLAVVSSTAYNLTGETRPVHRWGDFSQPVVDPTDDMTMWTTQEYVASSGLGGTPIGWGTAAEKLQAPPPAVLPSTSAAVAIGQASVPLALAGPVPAPPPRSVSRPITLIGVALLLLASLGLIGLTANIGLAYSLKFLWAPVLDRVALPGRLGRIGRRRGWLLFIQPALMLSIVALALSTPSRAPAFRPRTRAGETVSSRCDSPRTTPLP